MSVASLLGCASQQKQDSQVVRDVHISGNDEISSRQIKKKILTAETGWWPFAHKQHFDSVTWQSDLKRIERLYVANGFYQAEVVKDEVRPDPPDGVELEVQVSEGKPTKVGKLDVAFDGPALAALTADDRDAAQQDLPLAPGKVFREEDWAATKRLLAEHNAAIADGAEVVEHARWARSAASRPRAEQYLGGRRHDLPRRPNYAVAQV